MNKGSYGIATFYLSLIESSEQLHGLPAHYQLAGELKQIGTGLHVLFVLIMDGTVTKSLDPPLIVPQGPNTSKYYAIYTKCTY